MRAVVERLLLCAAVLASAASCAEEGGIGADGGSDAGADGGADGDSDSDVDGLYVEAVEPADGAVVRMNQKIHVRFSAGADGDFIDPATVQILVDDSPVRAWEYFDEALGNRELRFVPFPVWEPSSEHEVTVAAGAAYAGDPSLELAEDYVWSFTVEDAPFLEQYDSAATPGLSPDELATMAGSDAGVFAEEELVKDWTDPASTLYEISIPVHPDDPDVVAFAEKLIASLGPLSAVGIAAPQVGVGRRLFAAAVNSEERAFVNPIVDTWSADDWYTGFAEGCLSIDGVSSLVSRPASISVEFDTPEGGHVTGYELAGYDAKVFLHEYDHLNGILMTDREERRSW
jgi:peptide deformylase